MSLINCAKCGREFDESEATMSYIGNMFCPECADEFLFTCEECGRVVRTSRKAVINDEDYEGKEICRDCAENKKFIRCEDCGEYFNRDFIRDCNGRDVCENCFERYSPCEECGYMVHEDYSNEFQGRMVCDGCYDDLSNDEYIRERNPVLTVLRADPNDSSDETFGFELEFDNGYHPNEFADEFISQMPAWAGPDGSLTSYGVEIKTAPFTRKWFMNNKERISYAINTAEEYDYESSEEEHCGLHIHISRAGFEDTDHLYVFSYLIDSWEYNIMDFTRRENTNWCRYRMNRLDDDFNEYKDYIIQNGSGEKSAAVNWQHSKTLEVRIFAGSDKPDEVLASVEFIMLVKDYAWYISRIFDEKTLDTGFYKFLNWIKESKALEEESFSEFAYQAKQEWPSAFAEKINS